MSKKKEKTTSSSKGGFVSFGQVAGLNLNTPQRGHQGLRDGAGAIPLYTGDDPELSVLCKKLLKKDTTTKIKALNDLVDVLPKREEYVVGQFLPYFVYVYTRLSLEDSRAVRELLNAALDSVLIVEKRLLSPHMQRLIGPWWVLTGDPAPEVAGRAHGVFLRAIPPKKRPQVLSYLFPSIVKELRRNLAHKPGTLCDLAVTPKEEAEEKHERLLVSTLACLARLLDSLSLEQNAALCAGVDAVDAEEGAPSTVRYGDVIDGALWKMMRSPYPPVRKACYQLLACVTTQAPSLLQEGLDAPLCDLLLTALVEEESANNLAALLDAFVQCIAFPAFHLHVSVHRKLVPRLVQLLKTRPQQLLPYLLPAAGSVPAQHTAAMEVLPAVEGSDEDKSVDGWVTLLRLVTAHAERAAENAGEGRRAADSALAAAQADLCVVELGTLLLLRRSRPTTTAGSEIDLILQASWEQAEGEDTPASRIAKRIRGIADQVVQSATLVVHAAASALQRAAERRRVALGQGQEDSAVDRALGDALLGVGIGAEVEGLSVKSALELLQAVSRPLTQLHRASLQQMHVGEQTWHRLLWQPLSAAATELLLASFDAELPEAGAGAGAGAGSEGIAGAELSSAAGAVLRCMGGACSLAQSLLVALPLGPCDVTGGGGSWSALEVPRALLELCRDELRLAGRQELAHQGQQELGEVGPHSLLQAGRLTALARVLVLLKGALRSYPASAYLDDVAALTMGAVVPIQVIALTPTGTTSTSVSALVRVLGAGLLDTLDAVFHEALESEGAVEEVEGGRSWQERCGYLQQTCMQHGCVEGLRLIALHQMRRLPSKLQAGCWDDNAIAWVAARGRDILCEGVGTEGLAAMLSFCAHPAFDRIASQWVELAVDRWKQRGNSQSFLLSLMTAALTQQQRDTSSDQEIAQPPPLSADLVKALLDLGEVECLLVPMLASLFFSRSRTHPRAGGDRDRGVRGKVREAQVPVVGSWGEVRQWLLPVLPEGATAELEERVIAVLNSVFVEAEVRAEVLAGAGEEEQGRSGLQPRKWALHLCGLAAMSQSQAPAGVDWGLRVLLLQTGFWRSLLTPAQAAATGAGTAAEGVKGAEGQMYYALRCVGALLGEEQEEEQGQATGAVLVRAYLLGDAALSFALLSCALHVQTQAQTATQAHIPTVDGLLGVTEGGDSGVAQEVIDGLLGCVARLPAGERTRFLLGVLGVAEAEMGQGECAVSALLLTAELPAGSVDAEAPLVRLESPSLGPSLGADVQKGAAALYLRRSSTTVQTPLPRTGAGESAAETEGRAVVSLTALPCRVVAVHKEGPEPYFTVALREVVGEEEGREVQVEWPRLLMAPLGEILLSGADLISESSLEGEVEALRAEALQVGVGMGIGGREAGTQSPLVGPLCCWLEAVLLEAAAALLPKSRSSGGAKDGAGRGRKLALLLQVLRRLCAHVQGLGRLHPLRRAVEVRCVARARSLCLALLSTRGDASSPPWQAGVLLLEALLVPLGVGRGLWLPAVLLEVRRRVWELTRGLIPAAFLSDRDIGLAGLALALERILAAVGGWRLCLQLAQDVLAQGLAALPSKAPDLAPRLLRLLRVFWARRCEERASASAGVGAGAEALAPWEVEGFDFALFAAVEGLPSRQASDHACAALHFCLLGRSRRSCLELMGPSLVEKFAPQLEAFVCTSPTTSITVGEGVSVTPTLRLTACKVLDAWEACRQVQVQVQVPETETTDEGEEDEAGVALVELERRGLAQDELLLREVVGGLCADQLRRRCHAPPTLPSQSFALDEGAEEEEKIDAEVEAEEVRTDAGTEAGDLTVTEGNTSLFSGASHKVSRKKELARMMREDPLGSVLLWLLVLQRLDARAAHSWPLRARCVNFLRRSGTAGVLLQLLLLLAGDLLQFKDVSALLQRVQALSDAPAPPLDTPRQKGQGQGTQSKAQGSISLGNLQQLAAYALFRTVCTLPALFRAFWSDDCSRVQKSRLSRFVEERVRASLLGREVALIAQAAAAGRWNADEFSVRASAVSGEVTATLTREDTRIEISVQIPPSYPLRNVDVSCTSRIGVSDGRWRRWVLQMIQLLSQQDGSMVDAVLMWKCNIEKELEGIEPCPICYCTLHVKTLCLPVLACPTCNNKFHAPCLYTWFRSSGKNKCVICQQPFFH